MLCGDKGAWQHGRRKNAFNRKPALFNHRFSNIPLVDEKGHLVEQVKVLDRLWLYLWNKKSRCIKPFLLLSIQTTALCLTQPNFPHFNGF